MYEHGKFCNFFSVTSHSFGVCWTESRIMLFEGHDARPNSDCSVCSWKNQRIIFLEGRQPISPLLITGFGLQRTLTSRWTTAWRSSSTSSPAQTPAPTRSSTESSGNSPNGFLGLSLYKYHSFSSELIISWIRLLIRTVAFQLAPLRWRRRQRRSPLQGPYSIANTIN